MRKLLLVFRARYDVPGTLVAVLLFLSCAHSDRMSDLLEEQRASDGEGTFIVEEKLFDALLDSPRAFYEAMAMDSLMFNRFVEDLESCVFTDYNYGEGPDPGLEVKRLNAIKHLSAVHIDFSYEAMHSRVLSTLKELRAREID